MSVGNVTRIISLCRGRLFKLFIFRPTPQLLRLLDSESFHSLLRHTLQMIGGVRCNIQFLGHLKFVPCCEPEVALYTLRMIAAVGCEAATPRCEKPDTISCDVKGVAACAMRGGHLRIRGMFKVMEATDTVHMDKVGNTGSGGGHSFDKSGSSPMYEHVRVCVLVVCECVCIPPCVCG